MSETFGEAIGNAGESSPSVGLAVVDSMAGCRIKAFASHAQAFRKPAPRIHPPQRRRPAAKPAGLSPTMVLPRI
jgi:hypothetical protein